MLGLSARAILVDNASTDGTPEYAQNHFPWCRVIRSTNNGGYSYGNNIGFKAAGFPEAPLFEYVLLLNPDTELPANALRTMLTYMHDNTSVGVLGPKLILTDGTLDKACKRGLPTPLVALNHFTGLSRLFPKNPYFARYNMTFLDEDITADVDSTVGACELIRGKALSQAGLLDERFFMYGEDLDLNLRIRKSGYRIVYHPAVTVTHLKGSSSRQEPARMIRAFYDSMKLFHKKHFADKHPYALNIAVYAAVNLLCAYKLLRNHLKPPARRTVRSAPRETD